MEKINSLEKIVMGVGYAVGGAFTVTVIAGLAAATLGAIGTGIYEGYTGNKIFGAENPTPLIAAAAGYLTPIVGVIGSSILDSDSRGNDEAFLGALICPIGPIVSGTLYATGYGVGKLFS